MAEETVISLPVPASALWALLGVVLALFLIVSAIVHHHWSYYGLRPSDKSLTVAVYYVVSGAMFAGMVVSAAAYGAI